MENANVRLSAEEHKLVQDANILLTKNAVIEKVKALLAAVSERSRQYFTSETPLAFNRPLTAPRITRGENYLGLPWVAMDYPRIFKQQGVSAIRCIFWWGHHFSCTWHCSGVFKQEVEEKVLERFEHIAKNNWLVYSGDNEWAHELSAAHRETMNMTQSEFEQILKQRDFFKLCKYLPLTRFNDTTAFYDTCFEEILNMSV